MTDGATFKKEPIDDDDDTSELASNDLDLYRNVEVEPPGDSTGQRKATATAKPLQGWAKRFSKEIWPSVQEEHPGLRISDYIYIIGYFAIFNFALGPRI